MLPVLTSFKLTSVTTYIHKSIPCRKSPQNAKGNAVKAAVNVLNAVAQSVPLVIDTVVVAVVALVVAVAIVVVVIAVRTIVEAVDVVENLQDESWMIHCQHS